MNSSLRKDNFKLPRLPGSGYLIWSYIYRIMNQLKDMMVDAAFEIDK